jgi:hypothetical protein
MRVPKRNDTVIIAYISLITALIGLVTAVVNAFLGREHRIKNDRRFREVHVKINNLNGKQRK